MPQNPWRRATDYAKIMRRPPLAWVSPAQDRVTARLWRKPVAWTLNPGAGVCIILSPPSLCSGDAWRRLANVSPKPPPRLSANGSRARAHHGLDAHIPACSTGHDPFRSNEGKPSWAAELSPRLLPSTESPTPSLHLLAIDCSDSRPLTRTKVTLQSHAESPKSPIAI